MILPPLALTAILTIALLAAPLTVEAEPGKVYRLGHLSSLSPSGGQRLFGAFKQGLRDLGYVEGRNLVIEHRWAEGDYDRLPILAKELVGLNPDLIVSSGGPPTARAAKAATTAIPVVFVSGRALAEGIVSSLARPGGNVTGLEVLAEDLDAKRLELLKDALPKAGRVAVLWTPGTPEAEVQRRVLDNAAPALGVKLRLVAVRHPDEIEQAFAAMARDLPDALLVSAEPMFFDAARRIVSLAAQARLPTVYFVRTFAEGGGLMSYGPDFAAVYRRAAAYVDKILKGVKPADLPVEQPTKFELVINLRTAKARGLTISRSVLARADEIIE